MSLRDPKKYDEYKISLQNNLVGLLERMWLYCIAAYTFAFEKPIGNF